VQIRRRDDADYRVLVGEGLLADPLAGLPDPPRRVLLVVDANLPRPTIEPIIRRLDQTNVRWGVSILAANEHDKSLATLERVLAEAGRLRLERGDAVLTLGGGIVCDVGGLAAALYRRGVRVIQGPTTLLAMVDAAVGGKTAANLLVPADALSSDKHRLVKNLVGAFHQPCRVLCDTATLRTLPMREFRAGLAECFKHGLIAGAQGDARLLAWTQQHLDRILAQHPATLAEIIARNIAVKARVVAKDPHELSPAPDGGRMMLNLGHTFAHAIEPLAGLSWLSPGQSLQIGPLKHGEAVGLGLLCAARTAAALKLAPASLAQQIEQLLTRTGLPTHLRGLPDSRQVFTRMLDDKKVAGGSLRLILPLPGGRARVVSNPPERVVLAAIDSLREPGASA
jgi:3-dehydroquinate synthase